METVLNGSLIHLLFETPERARKLNKTPYYTAWRIRRDLQGQKLIGVTWANPTPYIDEAQSPWML